MLASSSFQGTAVPCQTRQQQQGRNARRARAAVRVQAEQQQGERRLGPAARLCTWRCSQAHWTMLICAPQRLPMLQSP